MTEAQKGDSKGIKTQRKFQEDKFSKYNLDHSSETQRSGVVQTLNDGSLCPAHIPDDEVLYSILATFMLLCSSLHRQKLTV